MKTLLAAIVVALALGASAPDNAVQYFSRVRDVRVQSTDRQNYAVVDEEIWAHARPDLGDLRLYSGATEVPYALVAQSGSTTTREAGVTFLNLGQIGNTIRFVIEPGGDEYDRITLRLSDDARDFVTRATVEGTDDLRHGPWTLVGSYPLYDFSREKLGSNLSIAIPVSRYNFLRLTIPELKPEHIKGASIAMTSREEARWSVLPMADQKIAQERGNTVVTWRQLTKAPVERLRFVIDPSQTNFRRRVMVEEIRDSRSSVTIADGNIGRIHFAHGDKSVDTQDTDIDIPSGTGAFRVTIENGDDPPLRLQAVQALTHERRMYFDPQSAAQAGNTQLCYGDAALHAPVYDYAKLFHADPEAKAASLGKGRANPAYKGRPDQRPWTERHGWVLWVALLIAVVGLGAVALRGLKANVVKG